MGLVYFEDTTVSTKIPTTLSGTGTIVARSSKVGQRYNSVR